jgi:hypothetical protein
MNANVVTAKQTDTPFGIDPVPACRDFGIPRQREHHALTSRPPAGGTRPARLLGARQLPTIGLISLSFSNSQNLCISDCIPDLTPLFVGQPEIYRRGYPPTVAIDADLQGDGATSPAT